MKDDLAYSAEDLTTKLQNVSDGKEISCKNAFTVIENTGVSPLDVGKLINKMDMKITCCQLGLFGYKPEKKILKPADTVSEQLYSSIMQYVNNGRIICADVWKVADSQLITRLDAASACEKLSLKIKKCQLGAF
ncbi:MAG: hypothetical protein ACOCX9_04885 [Spirochaetota bacterium]